MKLNNKWALVTGASSGLGIDFSNILAKRSMNLVIVARRVDRLNELKQTIEKTYNVKVEILVADLSLPNASLNLSQSIDKLNITIDVLINNAGFGLYGDFIDTQCEEINKMLNLDIIALTELTHIYATKMKQNKSGYILLIGSVAAFQPTPNYASYGAAKSYVLNFGQALAFEMKKHGVTISTLNPGATKTEFLKVSGQNINWYQELALMDSYPVCAYGIKKMFHGTPSAVPGFFNQLGVILVKILPRNIQTRAAAILMKS